MLVSLRTDRLVITHLPGPARRPTWPSWRSGEILIPLPRPLADDTLGS